MSSEVYVQVARDLGQVTDEKGKQVFLVGNAFVQKELHVIEYVVWKEVMAMTSIEAWRKELSDKIKKKTNVPFEKIETYLLQQKLIHSFQFKGLEDDDLKNLFVIRNAMAEGERDGNWIITSHGDDEKLTLSEENYQIWVIASSQKSLLEITRLIGELKKCSLEQALELLIVKATLFIRTGLWNVTYQRKNESKKSESAKRKSVKGLLLGLGMEMGNLNTEEEETYFVMNQEKKIKLTSDQYGIWMMALHGIFTSEEVVEFSEMEEKYVQEQIDALVDLQLVVYWKEMLTEKKASSYTLTPKGMLGGMTESGEWKMRSYIRATPREVSEFKKILWILSDSSKTLSQVLEEIAHKEGLSLDLLYQYATSSIPEMIRYGYVVMNRKTEN